ncbi:MAG: radical SAM protein [Flavobacteriales bacterium]|nr:radical SAM protein [Flavobacteriales bacterium]
MNVGLVYPNEGRKEKALHVGLASVAAFARRTHPDVRITVLDTRIAGPKRVERFLSAGHRLVGITAMAGIFKQVLSVARRIKERDPSTVVCVGGPYATTLGRDMLEHEDIDIVVLGEGEETFSEVIGRMKQGADLRGVAGLVHRGPDGTIIEGPARSPIRSIDDLPMPAYDLFDMDAYPVHRIVTSRGCPYKCTFCSSAVVWEHRWKKRSPESLVDEMEYLVKEHGRKTFFFNDDSFNMSMDRAEQICDQLIARKLNVLWSTPLRADRITDALAAKMKQAGCYNVGIGIESANNALLARMKKDTTIEQITQGIRTFRRHGIEVLGQFLIGNIGETWQTFRETLDYALSSELDFVLFYSVVPYRGTEQWDHIRANGRFLHHVMHEFQDVEPRILFETPEFTHAERLEAIRLTKAHGFYVDDNRMSLVFDYGRSMAKHFQRALPPKAGNALYLAMKRVYREHLRNTLIKH